MKALRWTGRGIAVLAFWWVIATWPADGVCGRPGEVSDTAVGSVASEPSTPAEANDQGSITGKVVDAKGAPVASACVMICDASSGIPLSRQTHRPFTEEFLRGRTTMDLAYAVTDENGRFASEKLPAGRYRLVAQSWKDAQSIKGLLEVNGKLIELHGVADDVPVPSDAAGEVVLRPLGTGTLRIDEEVGNDETLLVVSTSPPRADPILRFAGWGGAFMQDMIGGNRMPKGETTIYGLPEGKVYLTVFAADDSPGWGAGEATVRADATAIVYVPIVAAWSDGHHEPPERLRPLFEEVKTLFSSQDFSMAAFLKAKGIDLKPAEGMWDRQLEIGRHLGDEIELPSGTKTTFGDFSAAGAYVELGRFVERRLEQRKRQAALDAIESPQGGAGAEVTYEEAFVDLFKRLGAGYPCFELKGIDWMAVGEELLPRAKEVQTDEEFGRLCLELVARLEDSHAYLRKGTLDPPWPPFPRWDPGLACLVDDRGKPVVYYVDPGGPAEAAGVKIGMTALAINGKPAGEAIEQCMKQTGKYMGYSSQRYLRYQASRWFVRQTERGTMVGLEMQEPGGPTRTFELSATLGVRYLPRLPVPIPGIPDTANVSWTMLEGNVGYIYVRRIQNDLIERLDQAVGQLKDARGLVVDVRGNSGGGFDAGRSHRNFAPDDDEEPERPRFQGPVALVIDARCISAGEGWASWFIANQRARVFGETTAGASSRKQTYTLKNGLYQVTYPVKAYRGFLDRPIERRGLEPDVALMQNAQDLAAGRDSVLEAARGCLLELPAKTEAGRPAAQGS